MSKFVGAVRFAMFAASVAVIPVTAGMPTFDVIFPLAMIVAISTAAPVFV